MFWNLTPSSEAWKCKVRPCGMDQGSVQEGGLCVGGR